MTDDATRAILEALTQHKNTDHGADRYNTPWRPGSDGGSLSVQRDSAYGLGLKWYDHKTGEAGNGWTLAQLLGIAIGGHKVESDTPYSSLADYAHAHGIPLDVLKTAGWSEKTRAGQLVFAFKTATGMRYRYADPARAKRKYDSDKGYSNCWYGLERAVQLASASGSPLVLCNGEVSTVAAQHHSVPACCVTGGEKGTMTAELLSQLQSIWSGPVLVAYDCDLTGRKSSKALARFLADAGLPARAIDLRGGDGYDLADFCRLYNGTSAETVLQMPELVDQQEVVRLSAADLARAHTAEPVTFPTPITAAALGLKQIEPTRYFIPEMLRTGLALFIGNPGIGKTPALIQLALAFATAGRWLGALQCPPCRVLYIGVEYDEAYIKEVAIDSFGSADLPETLFFLSVETFTPPRTEEESIAMLTHYLEHLKVDVVIIDVFSGFLPREKFKQDKYRGDYAEFLSYHRLFMAHKALIVGSWHGNKRDKDPETAYNGGQGMWGSAGGGRLTLTLDDENQVRLRSQLRGHERKEWVIEQARVGPARFWCVVDADPDPIFGSDAQRRIYFAVKRHSTYAEPLAPAGVKAILQADAPELGLREPYIRQTLSRLEEKGILQKWNGGYVVKSRDFVGSRGSLGSFGSGGSPGSDEEPEGGDPKDPTRSNGAIQTLPPQDAEIEGRSKRSNVFKDPTDPRSMADRIRDLKAQPSEDRIVDPDGLLSRDSTDTEFSSFTGTPIEEDDDATESKA
jgi:hypothetical protein